MSDAALRGQRLVEGACVVKEPELPIPVVVEHVEQRDEDVQLLVGKEGGADREQVDGVESEQSSVQSGEGGIATQLPSNMHRPLNLVAASAASDCELGGPHRRAQAVAGPVESWRRVD